MILHLVKSSPFSHLSLKNALNRSAEQDLFLLLQDAVVAVCVESDLHNQLLDLDRQERLYVLKEDLSARGLTNKYGKVVDYKGFVSLSCHTSASISW
ncbi:sulfurtransferase complex subunit TusB [Motilimonas pumila]|uniref:Sulfurtransferase complex subunit TusB n=1 Tax=Motilimonas pumila TaxID=2303987 RepID=A0A418Y9I3_9GAMM|nr:sulfurtransferase complex subunit TusB [Motilimonas pumila]RJG37447.1 sulfurtransferase complex subunit TusB [Motilimonas pumila]